MNKKIEEIVLEFYSIFEGNKFEPSYKMLKGNGKKVEPYFIEDWIRETLTKQEEGIIEKLFTIEKRKWNDAEHCSCLGYAIIQIAGGEESEKGKEMEERLQTLKTKSMNKKIEKKWEKEFDKRFCILNKDNNNALYLNEMITSASVKSFIRQLLTEQEGNVIERIKERLIVLKEQELPKICEDYSGDMNERICFDDGYTVAISDFKSFLKTLTNKDN